MNIASAVGFIWNDGGSAIFRWGEISRGWGITLQLINRGEDQDWLLHVNPIYGHLYLKLPLPHRKPAGDDLMERWGFCWRWGREWGSGDTIELEWNTRRLRLTMPWQWVFHRHSTLAPDGRSWMHELAGFNVRHGEVPIELPVTKNFWSYRDLPRWNREFPYRYALRSGEIQERTATVGIEEMEWRMRWLCWLPWPRLKRRTIDITFSDEVGERSGSWKGGCIACGYEFRRNETAEECLRRMERERKF